MALLKRRKNGNGSTALSPTTTNNFPSNRFFNRDPFDIGIFSDGLRMPPANISETKREFRINLSAPGLNRDDFKVEVDNGDLIISCEKEEEDQENKENYRRQEYSYTSFSRRFPLPDNAIDNKINAKYDNGILQVTIPKKFTFTRPKKRIQVA